ncbi:sulfurtransferase [Oleiphilus sp. HI0078]|nr:sulfurtransferase [Oleiphilus sp. HI0078]
MGNHIELSGLFVALLAALWFTERSRSGRAVSPQEATLLLNKDQAVIVDLRDKKDFSEGKITGALHIPFANLKERSTELEKYKDKQIILVDKMGQHSGMAGKTLQAEGFENVCRMSGGIAEWKNSNMPLVRK